jgi:hypothetical protein
MIHWKIFVFVRFLVRFVHSRDFSARFLAILASFHRELFIRITDTVRSHFNRRIEPREHHAALKKDIINKRLQNNGVSKTNLLRKRHFSFSMTVLYSIVQFTKDQLEIGHQQVQR